MKEKTKHISQLIRQCVNSVDPNADVILYGSRARGDERIDSDWDILVLTDYSVDLAEERKFRYKLYDLELETGEPLSIFVYSKKDWKTKQRITPFYENVIQEGVRI
ncbi:MAG: nucleotidyltransferase domain-containing protein [Bacteroidota bacterium]|nr:nucleotidyltransferase domain-containing protein [Bacteroidota bacterium]